MLLEDSYCCLVVGAICKLNQVNYIAKSSHDPVEPLEINLQEVGVRFGLTNLCKLFSRNFLHDEKYYT